MNSLNQFVVTAAETDQRSAILSLLRENNLPTADLDETKILFACLNEGTVIGTGGLEFFADCALLRSISVKRSFQKKGLGKLIVAELEKIAHQKGINCLYLLTTTAKDFFTKEGYDIVDRDKTPTEIRNTTEFSSVCPSTALVMRKRLT
jgi:amino-acid N-acetyltransferase